MLAFSSLFQTVSAADNNSTEFKLDKDVVVEEQGNSVSFTNPKDVVSFTSVQLVPEQLAKAIEGYKGLSDPAKADEALKAGNYIEVLKYLWSEKDHKKRLDWLKQKTSESHPVLLYEYAIETLRNNQPLNWDAFLQSTAVSFVANLRAMQDAQCFSDNSVQAAAGMLFITYSQLVAQDNLIDEKTTTEFMDRLRKDPKPYLQIVEGYFQPVVDGTAQLPSPDWIRYHGMASLQGQDASIPADECAKKRKEVAQIILDKLKEQYPAEKK
jgi:hypothetical protein